MAKKKGKKKGGWKTTRTVTNVTRKVWHNLSGFSMKKLKKMDPTKLVIGAAALGVGYWFFMRPASAATTAELPTNAGAQGPTTVNTPQTVSKPAHPTTIAASAKLALPTSIRLPGRLPTRM